MIRRSLRARLTLYYAVALAFILVLFSLGVYLLVRADLWRQMDRQLERDLRVVSLASAHDLEDIGDVEREAGVDCYKVVDGGRVVFRSEGWRKARLDSITVHSFAWTGASVGHGTYRFRSATVGTRPDKKSAQWPPSVGVTVARDAGPMMRSLRSLATISLVGFLCAIVLAVAGGYWMAGHALSPIRDMISKAEAITADKLSERLPVQNPDDELGRLASVFNNTLARLQDSFDRLRRFTSDASHELRTPLASIKSVGEVALRDGDDPAAYREAVSSMLEETDRLTQLTDSLLTLTRADSGRARLSRKPTDLGELTSEVVECLRVLADEKDLDLSAEIEEGTTAEVDGSILRQAVMNLLDNAIKYSSSGGSVAVSVTNSGARSEIGITDSGPGIPEEHRAKVFERFYRVEKARSGASGAGLGLAIAQWAVEANGGAIELETREGVGSTFRIVFDDHAETTFCSGAKHQDRSIIPGAVPENRKEDSL